MSRFSALIFAAALALSVAAPTLLAADKESPGVRNVVLVHGAWADASSWAKVIPLLEKAGLNVVAEQNPLTSVAADGAGPQRDHRPQSGPAHFVGHLHGAVGLYHARTGSKD